MSSPSLPEAKMQDPYTKEAFGLGPLSGEELRATTSSPKTAPKSRAQMKKSLSFSIV